MPVDEPALDSPPAVVNKLQRELPEVVLIVPGWRDTTWWGSLVASGCPSMRVPSHDGMFRKFGVYPEKAPRWDVWAFHLRRADRADGPATLSIPATFLPNRTERSRSVFPQTWLPGLGPARTNSHPRPSTVPYPTRPSSPIPPDPATASRVRRSSCPNHHRPSAGLWGFTSESPRFPDGGVLQLHQHHSQFGTTTRTCL